MNQRSKIEYFGLSLILLEVSLILVLISFTSNAVIAGVGTPNATVITNLNVGNVFPEIFNVSIEDDSASFSPTANTTATINCAAVVVDYNGEGDINLVNATFFDSVTSSADGADDNNEHYTNSSCTINTSFGDYNGYSDDAYSALANCTFAVEYYANPQTWTCEVTVTDNSSLTVSDTDDITIDQLIALALPDTIDYGTVNATEVSLENQTDIINVGNVGTNISLEGYGYTVGDGNAMNCTLGSNRNISIEYEKYNLSAPTSGALTLAEFEGNYTNLTTTPVIRNFTIAQRQNDTENDAINSTYWRLYVPLGVAGTCSGNIIFGATTAAGS